jgi:hypothetical protein
VILVPTKPLSANGDYAVTTRIYHPYATVKHMWRYAKPLSDASGIPLRGRLLVDVTKFSTIPFAPGTPHPEVRF